MILEVTADQIALLNDTDLRTLVGYLCEREVRAAGYSTSYVTWGGHQNAADGGIDVRVELPAEAAILGYVPKPATGFQVKAQDMPRGEILSEMAPNGSVLPSLSALAASGGAYVIVSSKGTVSETWLADRKGAMAVAVKELPSASNLTLDFYDRRRMASWVNQHPGLVPWVRERLGHPLSGWKPFDDWSSSPAAIDSNYLLDAQTRLVGPSIQNSDGLDAERALALLRETLAKPRGIVRLVGLSGVGKTRLIQALFDERVGVGALPQSDALYTDISDNPDPVPQEMLSRLVHDGHRVVLIVDNCGIDLHRKLAAKLSNSNSPLSVITVEYDINDDEPQNTDIFKLEPSSADLIEKMLEARYPNVAPPSRRVIASFSEGNSRVAFALADTARNGESLAKLSDTDLFERLFNQQKATSTELLDAAKTCALLYSFDGETLEGDDAELALLAKLAEQTIHQLHKQVAELLHRQLIQKRSKWRAILPHALANRLAKRALEEIPLNRIEEIIVRGSSDRTLRSFSRRIGYLHDNARAVALAERCLSSSGLLAPLGTLSKLGEEIFENVAPAAPAAMLAFIEEKASSNEDWFFGEKNINRQLLVRVIRSIAYDPDLFTRSASLLKRFVLSNAPYAADALKSLFWLYLSGTHAPATLRASFIETLLVASNIADQNLGLELLTEMLRSSHFSSSQSFEFGARKRDFGLNPRNGIDVRNWFTEVIELSRRAEASGQVSSSRLRHVMASSMTELLRIGMVDEVIVLANGFSADGGWPEAWIAVRRAMKRWKEKFSDEISSKLKTLEQDLRPTDLVGMIRSYALTAEWGTLDIAEAEDDEELQPLEAREKILDACVELGQQLAAKSEVLEAMLPEIISTDSQRVFALGRGVASGCASLPECWGRIARIFFLAPDEVRKIDFLGGFLSAAMTRSPDETEALLDSALSDPRLHKFFLYLQTRNAVNEKAFDRVVAALELDTIPLSSFVLLAHGRRHEGFDDEKIRSILLKLVERDGGSTIALEILGMRIFGLQSDKLPVSQSLKATARQLLAGVEFARTARFDHLVGNVVEAAYDEAGHEEQARAFCGRIIKALESWTVYGHDLTEVVAALAKTFPLVLLDVLVERADEGHGSLSTLFRDLRENAPCPLSLIPEEVLMEWANQKPETRYGLLAQAMRLSTSDGDDNVTDWSPLALRLIDAAPDPINVLDAFFHRFMPNGWVGSLADTLATRVPMIEALKHHAKPEVAKWANQRAPVFAANIERERAREAAEARSRDQAFE